LEEIEVYRSNLNSEKLTWSNQEPSCINIEAWRVIRDLIEVIQNQRLICKRLETSRTKIDRITGQLKENWKINGQLRVKMHKSETNDENEKKC
jgi:hypothetical protein